jgi:opacity protein-like surface antigen
MKRRFVISAAALLASAFVVPAVAAQAAPQPGVPSGSANRIFAVTPYAGYMIFGDYARGPLGTTIGAANAPIIGAQLGFQLTDNIAVVGNIARSSGDLRAGAPIVGGINVGSSTVMMYDAGVQLSAPMGDRSALPFTPFVQLGAGAMHHNVRAAFLTTSATNFAFNAGVGADVAIGDNLGLRLMAKDYIGRFDVRDATGINYEGQTSHNWKIGAGLTLRF